MIKAILTMLPLSIVSAIMLKENVNVGFGWLSYVYYIVFAGTFIAVISMNKKVKK